MTADATGDAVFEVDGEQVTPSLLSQGPWDPNAQHGGAVCGLLARTLERAEASLPMRFTRISFDLLRAIPLRPLQTQVRTVREGRRIQLVEATLLEGETEVARATGQRIRIASDLDTGTHPPRSESHAAPPASNEATALTGPDVPGFIRALEFIRADGEPDGNSERTVWIRLKVPLVRGEPTSPLVRLAATADFASGIANALDFTRFVSINPDVNLHIEREPRSPWLAARGSTTLLTDGTGQSRADFFDEYGRVGQAMTSLLVDHVGGAPPSQNQGPREP